MIYRGFIKSSSFLFLSVILLLNLINTLFNLNLNNFLFLNSNRIIEHFEFYRFITYPLILGNNLFIFIFAPILIFVSYKLEKYLNKYLYPIFLFMVSILNSFLITLIFWNKDIYISGAETIGFFILTLATLLIPKEKISRNNPLTIGSFSLILGIMWIIIEYATNTSNLLYSIAPLFGILTGFLIFIPLRNMKKYIEKREREIKSHQKQIKVNIPEPEELLTMRKLSNVNISQIYHKYEEDYCEISDNDEENEEKLNQILDKINEKGKDSLSHYEKKFLEEYSRRIK